MPSIRYRPDYVQITARYRAGIGEISGRVLFDAAKISVSFQKIEGMGEEFGIINKEKWFMMVEWG